jgi:hypothetical protein
MHRMNYKPAGIAALAALSLALLPARARAGERITLANGFDVVCDHHLLVEGKVRVYPKAAGEDYIELNPEAIRTVESVPDPPPEPAPAANVALKQETGTADPKSGAPGKVMEARLTPTDLNQLLSKAGSEHNVDEDLLASVVKMESGGNPHARSRAGAQGLMQLMPGTARQLGVADSYVADDNVRGGTTYLDSLLVRYHDNMALALAAYNAGPEAVDRYHGIPPYRETRLYVARVIHEFNRRVAARRKAQSSGVLKPGVQIAVGTQAHALPSATEIATSGYAR